MTQAILPTDMVSIHDNHPVTTSLKVAQYFERNHKDILKAIQNLMADCPAEFNGRNIAPVEYTDAKGEKRPMYYLHFDGFVLLAMGFTGKKALQIKLAYIEAFNAMREQIARQQSMPLNLYRQLLSSRKLLCSLSTRLNAFSIFIAHAPL